MKRAIKNIFREASPPLLIKEKASLCSPAIRMFLRDGNAPIVVFFNNEDIGNILLSKETFFTAQELFSGYSNGRKKGALFIEEKSDIENQYGELQAALIESRPQKREPALIAVQNLGLFAPAGSKNAADTVIFDFINTLKTGKPVNASDNDLNERAAITKQGGIAGKIVVITGSAQGFGKGIAEILAEEGAYIVVADINEPAAKRCAEDLCRIHGEGKALAVRVDVTQEDSIKNLMIDTVLAYGGIDVFISNAGILKAGSLEEMDLKTFELVTRINYSAYYLGTKHASHYMKIQHRFARDYWGDIIQINSKSGLAGSNKNFAYSGGKFGSIGLTQSFALELVDDNIKVNAVCPGNFFEGPLWSDPATGLFAQYLRAKKIPGATTIEEVKSFYENKVPMKRGCSVRDVATAVCYLIAQKYETGQALPVTGGQIMLK